MPTVDKIERAGRATLRNYGFTVESVPFIQREANLEFAAVVIPHEKPELYEGVLELFTRPNFPLVVTRERRGATDTRIYLAFPEGATS